MAKLSRYLMILHTSEKIKLINEFKRICFFQQSKIPYYTACIILEHLDNIRYIFCNVVMVEISVQQSIRSIIACRNFFFPDRYHVLLSYHLFFYPALFVERKISYHDIVVACIKFFLCISFSVVHYAY